MGIAELRGAEGPFQESWGAHGGGTAPGSEKPDPSGFFLLFPEELLSRE